MAENPIHLTIDAVWRIESASLIASLAKLTRDIGTAEELAHDALVAALEQWPASGIPDNPGAWLLATAKHRAIDRIRRDKNLQRRKQDIAYSLESQQNETPDIDAALDDDVGDNLLRLIFTACHPVLPAEARVALTLRVLGGLTTDEIARAFLVPETTVAQRIVRAKRTLSDKKILYEVPRGPELAARLDSVLEVLYLVFNEGYTATAGDDLMRPDLCEEALRLGRILAGLMPTTAEVHGLVALMEIQASRTPARTDAEGKPVLLLEQNRGLWDQLLIRRGFAALALAESLSPARGPYTLQATIAACHARAVTADQTDWAQIATIYGELAAINPSPIVQLNRAVAIGMAEGPQPALHLVDSLISNPALKNYHLLPAVRADLLKKLNRLAEARIEFERAAALTQNTREKSLLLQRATECKRP